MNNDNIENTIKQYDSAKNQLESNFSSYKSKRKIRILIKTLLIAFISLIASFLIFLLVERTPIQSELARYIFSGILYFGAVAWIYVFYNKCFKQPSDIAMAVEIENTNNHFNSILSSAIDFINKKEKDTAISTIMKKLTVASASTELKQEDIKQSLKTFSLKKAFFSLLAITAIYLCWYSISPIEVKTGTNRIIFPFASIAPWSNLEIDVFPKNAVTAVGENLEISAIPSRKIDEPIILELIDPESKEVNKVEMYADATATDSKLVYNLMSLQKSVNYRVTCEKAVSELYSIKVMPRPQIKKVIMTLFQPAYISSKPIVLLENTNETEILLNSKIRIDVEADMPLSSGELCFNNLATQSCEIIENKFSYEYNVATSTSFTILVKNEIGLTNEKAVVYKITAKPDLPPTIELLKPACDIEFPTSKILEVKAVAKDDFGVKTMVLYYKAGNRDDWKPLNVKSDFKPVPECEIEFPWMLDTIAVQPGTKIQYYLESEDACQPNPNVASTTIFFINMPSMQDVYKGQDRKQADLKQKLEEYIEEQHRRSESLKKAYEQVKHEEKLDFETSQAIEEAIKSGEKNQQAAEEILKSFENMQKSMENNPFTSPEALQRMQKVQDLLDQVLDKDSKQMLKNLQDSLKDIKLDPKDIQKYEEAFKLDEYMNSLDRTINLLEQVQQQQKFESIANSIEELYKRQQQIASETQELLQKQKEGQLSKEEENKLKDLQEQLQKQQDGQLSKEDQNKLMNDMQEILNKQQEKLSKEIENKLKDLQEQLQKQQDGQLSKEDQNKLMNDMQEMLNKQQEKLSKEIENKTKEIEDLLQKQKDSQLSKEEENKLKELQEQLQKQKDDLIAQENKLKELQEQLQKQKEGKLSKEEENKLAKDLQEQLQKQKDNLLAQENKLKELQEQLQKQKEGKLSKEEENKLAKDLQKQLQNQKDEKFSKDDENKLKDLLDQQKKISQDLEELQKKSEEMTKNTKNEDMKNNPLMEDVKNILDQMKNNDHKKMGEDIQKNMQNQNLDQAHQNQEKMLHFLEAIKKNANQMKSAMGNSQQKQLDLSYYISSAIKVSMDQEKLLKEIIDMPEQFMRGKEPQIEGIIDFVSVQQVLVKQRGLTLQDDLNQLVKNSFAIEPTAIEAINGTQAMFSDIVKNLEDRALESARRDQYEIIRRFNKLAADLMRAQDNSNNNSGGSSSQMNPMQQFKDLTRRQLSLYQQMMQQQLLPQGSQALKQMAMEQRHIRESLEQLMREHREQMNNLGRMNDVIDDMQDIETKILDPALREKVAEKQKSIYERMLKSQKAVKNRDEEDEERKAQKAREIHQQEPDKPIGDIGSGSIDLSKDFTGDLREEYPESYKTLINDYYKSLNIYGGDQR